MDNQVEEIKNKLDIVNVISQYLTLKKRGRHFLACCPFHGEKTPSFTVSPELQIFKCFGCGKGGDIFTFLQEYEKIDFREALEILAKQAGITLKRSAEFTQSYDQKKKILEINNLLSHFYHFVLTKHDQGKQALNYLNKRQISSKTINTFKIGYSPQNSNSLLNFLSKKGYKPQELIASGTFGQSYNRLYDRFRHRLVFPLINHRDQIVAFSGRILPSSGDQKLAKYINSPETDLYHKGGMFFGLNLARNHIRKKDSVIVVEGEFDMISPFQAGIKNIVALKGTAFTQDQLRLLKRYTENLVLSFDSDFAGTLAARKSIELADSIGFNIKVLDLKNKYKDPDEAVLTDLPFFKKQVKHSLSIWDYLIRSAVSNFGIDTDKGKKQILSFTLPFLAKIDNSVIKSDYLRKLAAELGVDKNAVAQEADKLSKPNANNNSVASISFIHKPSQEILRTEKLEEYLLVLLFSAQNPIELLKEISPETDLDQILSMVKFKTVLNLLSKQKNFIAISFSKKLPPELKDIFASIYISATANQFDQEKILLEINKVIKNIKLVNLKTTLKELSLKIARLENRGPGDELKKTEEEYNLTIGKLSKLQS
ncbi:DNA primase [Patescibacteria group bacterium]|nr:DNA primase [Patescibacteria group bacterium]MCG2702577.1 DNA primase [Candidatus Parcubacteria bacterium]MBU4264923.1 DNA primase [Patescibacteria group bacterium]MBU4390807.1 DNA primase [Patescibacteria group bacterium]MBU4396836.1 DNA primase [Patescibacteria group bacterium]